MNRDFKGIWVPREIWLHQKLSMQAKILWAEIYSLHDREKGGCYATNEYLCDFLGLKLSRLKEVLKELRNHNLLEDVAFDGRIRLIRAKVPEPEYGGHLPAGKPATSTPPQPENRLSAVRNTGHPIYIDRDTSLDKRATYNGPPPEKAAGQKISFNYETGEFSNITDKHRDLFKKAYPLVNLDSEIPKAVLWLINPKNKKKKDFEAFLNNWFSNSQKELESNDKRVKTFNNLNKKPEKRIESAFSYEGAGTMEECHKPIRCK